MTTVWPGAFALPPVDRGSIAGLPTFWSEMPGPLRVALVFRVGVIDQTQVNAGITHLVEHLVLSSLGKVAYPHNGRVEMTRTAFTAAGSPQEICEFVGAVTTALHSLPCERIDIERQVLRTEAASRNPGALGLLMASRYGTTGPGLINAEELGLLHIGEGALRAWTRRFFTDGNVAMWLSGAPPDGLVSHLGSGDAAPLPATPQLPLSYPSYAQFRGRFVCVGSVINRDPDLSGLVWIARERIADGLRAKLGISYQIDSLLTRLGPDEVHVMIAADTLGEHASAVTKGVLDVLTDLADSGTTDEERDAAVKGAVRSFDDPSSALSVLDDIATRTLNREDADWPDQIVARLADSSSARHAELAASLLDGSFWIMPARITPPEWRYQPVPDWSTSTTQGKVFTRHGVPLNSRAAGEALIIGADGISITDGPRTVTIRFSECSAMQRWVDGPRRLFAHNGNRILVDPMQWLDGGDVPGLLDGSIPSELWIEMGAMRPPGALPPVSPKGLAKWRTPLWTAAILTLIAGIVLGEYVVTVPNPEVDAAPPNTFLTVVATVMFAVAIAAFLTSVALLVRIRVQSRAAERRRLAGDDIDAPG